VRRVTLSIAIGCLAVSAALAGSPKGAAAPLSHNAFHRVGGTNAGLLKSSNWSGIAVTGKVYTAVAGSWKVPTVIATPGSNRYASDWVGIGGFNTSDLIQAGTSEMYTGGHASYNAWTEILPASEAVIPGFTVHPGDLMTVVITKGSGNAWTMVVTDSTLSESFTKHVNYASTEGSAEWIHEAPQVNGSVVDIASTTNAIFDHGTVNGSTVIGSAGTQKRIQLTGAVPGDTKATPSKLDSDKDGIAVADGSTAPPPPAS
jgi:Peptidase A4 family